MKENKVLKQMVILLLLLTVVNTAFLVLSYNSTKDSLGSNSVASTTKTAEVSLNVQGDPQEKVGEVTVTVVEDESSDA
jgi:hypothetical protein